MSSKVEDIKEAKSKKKIMIYTVEKSELLANIIHI